MTVHPSFDLDSLTNCIVLIDEHGVIDTINQAAQVLFETSSQRAIGMPFEQLAMVPGSEGIDWYETLMSVALGKLPAVSRDLRFRLRSGKEITVDVVITPLQYESDSRILLEMSPLDRVRAISETENLREAQKRLHNVVKGLAHEVKNPLGGIRGAAQLINKRFDDPTLDQYTDIIISEVDRLQVLVDRMLGPRESL
jgi:two-component system nitrogen regulation sensor histidine kinase GlnL